mmetsp:Transcript_22716/g.54378  ORF Transcript_22716/g.54378 Transcript_22716/m.54378 type:complete len:525 (-) Transcript_22716:390-1964(-)
MSQTSCVAESFKAFCVALLSSILAKATNGFVQQHLAQNRLQTPTDVSSQYYRLNLKAGKGNGSDSITKPWALGLGPKHRSQFPQEELSADLHASRRGKANATTVPRAARWCGTAALSEPRSALGAVTVGESLALFAGGLTKHGSPSSRVDIYDAAALKWRRASLSVARSWVAAAAVGHLALFAGGMSTRGESGAVDIFDSETGRWTVSRLSTPRRFIAACSADTGERKVAVFAGGTVRVRTGFIAKSARVDIFHATQRKWTRSMLSEGRTKSSCVGIGSKIIVAGGYSSSGYSRRVDILDINTMRWRIARISRPRQWAAAIAAPPLAFFAGGQWCNIGSCNGGWIRSADIDVYNLGTGRWTVGAKMMEARSNAAAASTPDGRWAVLAGGNTNVHPARFFKDPLCRCNCEPRAEFRPATEKDAPSRAHLIPYPRVPARSCRRYRSSRPVGTKSSAVDLYSAESGSWTQERLPVSRALGAAAGVRGRNGTQLIFAGGEIRTMHLVPTNLGGTDYHTDRVDFLCLPG